jgi:hypothetical protein
LSAARWVKISTGMRSSAAVSHTFATTSEWRHT